MEAIGHVPDMDEVGLECFKVALSKSNCYLEYGSGGSTVYAANTAKVPVIISVESNNLWVLKVQNLISSYAGKLHLEYCDLGEVGSYGTPKNKEKVDNFWTYMARPWQIAKANEYEPDTVLIDGRFRVASFLFSLVSAAPGTTILFDDYLNRPGYSVVEKFCALQERHGRMGVFKVNHSYSVPDICEKIAQHSVLWD